MRPAATIACATLCATTSACGLLEPSGSSGDLEVVVAQASPEGATPAPAARTEGDPEGEAGGEPTNPRQVILDCATSSGYEVATHVPPGANASEGLYVAAIYETGTERGGGRHPMGHARFDFDLPGDNVLALYAYEPVTWHIDLDAGAAIREILLFGYQDQVVEGVGDDVRVLRMKRPECASYEWPQQDEDCQGPGLGKAAEAASGRSLSRFDGCYEAATFQFLPGLTDTD